MNLKQAWAGHISPEDYDAHMLGNGQAETNALLLRELVAGTDGESLLIAGAGTGQFLELAPVDYLEEKRVLCTDLNPAFLQMLQLRARAAGGLQLQARQHDLELDELPTGYDAVALVLVLEHVDWRSVLLKILGSNPNEIFLILQEDGPQSVPTTPVGSMSVLFNEACPLAVAAADVQQLLENNGYRLLSRLEREVPGNKKMVGLAFRRGDYPAM